MKLLAIETSSHACSVALLINNEISAIHEIAPMQQTQKILPIIDKLLRSADILLNQLDAIAFGCGPGSFTGVRIATSVAQGLGFAANLPLIPISSLAALAQAVYTDVGWNKILVGVDARIQEVYWGMYKVNPSGLVELQGKEIVCAPENVILPAENDWYGAGTAWEVYSKQIPFNPIETDSSRLPMASAILDLAKAKFEKKLWVNAADALPTYLRDNVAKKQ